MGGPVDGGRSLRNLVILRVLCTSVQTLPTYILYDNTE